MVAVAVASQFSVDASTLVAVEVVFAVVMLAEAVVVFAGVNE